MKKIMMIMTLLLAVVGIGIAGDSEEWIREEIMKHVVDPCYTELAGRYPVSGWSTEFQAQATKEMHFVMVDNLVLVLMDMVRSKPEATQKDRMALYELVLPECINDAEKKLLE